MRFINTLLSLSLLLISIGFISIADAKPKSNPNIAKLNVMLPAIPDGGVIPGAHAFCIEDGKGKSKFGGNKSPEIKWSGAPKGTKSFVLIANDPHVPSKIDNLNKEGRVVSKDLPRITFYHWVLIDIPSKISHLPAGSEGEGVVLKGKKIGKTDHGVRGLNTFGDWFASNKDMSGQYGGYDGPCPPWNDEIVHEYYFEVFALDVPSLNLKGGFRAPDVIKAMAGHILAQGKSAGHYKLNTAVKY
jgi:Raf kinase inhibitor-like YbhB/YbcL family protein